MLRRNFVKNITLSAAAISVAPIAKAVPPANQPLGVQLWTIRSYLQKDLTGSLTRLAKLGYNEVELFDYDGTY